MTEVECGFAICIGDDSVTTSVVDHPLGRCEKPLQWRRVAGGEKGPAGGAFYPLVFDLVLGDDAEPKTWVQILIPLRGEFGRKIDEWNHVLHKHVAGFLGLHAYVAKPEDISGLRRVFSD